MSADLILYTCPHPRNLGLSDAEGKERLRKYAEALTEQEVDAFLVDFCDETSLKEAYAGAVGDGDLEHLAQAQVDGRPLDPALAWGREYVWGKIEHAYTETVESHGARDVAGLCFGGLTFLVSGGMSRGDEPTTAGPLLGILNWTGAFATDGAEGEFRKGTLDLSTEHVPYEKLERNVPDLAVDARCCAHDHGWLVFLGDSDRDNEAPDWFRPILKLARALGCDFINFDMDGTTTDLLPRYSQES